MAVQLCATFTNWELRGLTPFLLFIETIDKDKPDFLGDLKSEGKVPQSAEQEGDLAKYQRKDLRKRRARYRLGLQKSW